MNRAKNVIWPDGRHQVMSSRSGQDNMVSANTDLGTEGEWVREILCAVSWEQDASKTWFILGTETNCWQRHEQWDVQRRQDNVEYRTWHASTSQVSSVCFYTKFVHETSWRQLCCLNMFQISAQLINSRVFCCNGPVASTHIMVAV